MKNIELVEGARDGAQTMNLSIRRNIFFSYLDVGCYSITVGMGESYLAAYILAKGYSELSSSLISTVPLVMGGILQLFTPFLVYHIQSYRQWVVAMSFLQGMALLLFGWTSFVSQIPIAWLFLISALYWGTGLATGPAWNSWLGTLIPHSIRSRFFARRNIIYYFFILLSLIVSGLSLEFVSPPHLLTTFGTLFIIAGTFRIFSSFFLFMHQEKPFKQTAPPSLPFNVLRNQTLSLPIKKLIIYLTVFILSVHFSAGFFNPYMLKVLKLPVWLYMILIASAFVSRIAILPLAHKLIQNWGSEKILLLSVCIIIPIPVLWIFSSNFFYLLILQLFTGVAWSLYELITFLFLFNDIPPRQKTSILTLFSFFQTSATVGGALLGGSLFKLLSETPSAYWVLFGVSSLLRLSATYWLFPFKIRTEKKSVDSLTKELKAV